jgi:hypothetical protein
MCTGGGDVCAHHPPWPPRLGSPRAHHHIIVAGPAAGTRSLFIKVESTPNPDSMKFLPEDKEVLPEKFGTGMVGARSVPLVRVAASTNPQQRGLTQATRHLPACLPAALLKHCGGTRLQAGATAAED